MLAPAPSIPSPMPFIFLSLCHSLLFRIASSLQIYLLDFCSTQSRKLYRMLYIELPCNRYYIPCSSIYSTSSCPTTIQRAFGPYWRLFSVPLGTGMRHLHTNPYHTFNNATFACPLPDFPSYRFPAHSQISSGFVRRSLERTFTKSNGGEKKPKTPQKNVNKDTKNRSWSREEFQIWVMWLSHDFFVFFIFIFIFLLLSLGGSPVEISEQKKKKVQIPKSKKVFF